MQQSHSQNDHRSKFENNISASFASRQKRDDDQHPNSRSYNDSRGANKWSGKPSTTNPRHNSQETNAGPYNKSGNARSQNTNYSQNSYQNSAPPSNNSYGQKYSKNFNESVSLVPNSRSSWTLFLQTNHRAKMLQKKCLLLAG